MVRNTTGLRNVAVGQQALDFNTTGNTAAGVNVLYSNRTGYYNTADDVSGLFFNVGGHDNLAEGYKALLHNTGSNNVGLGSNAGGNLTTGSNVLISALTSLVQPARPTPFELANPELSSKPLLQASLARPWRAGWVSSLIPTASLGRCNLQRALRKRSSRWTRRAKRFWRSNK